MPVRSIALLCQDLPVPALATNAANFSVADAGGDNVFFVQLRD